MTGERRKVLSMLYERKIDVEEAEGLLAALEIVPEEAPELEIEFVSQDLKVKQVLDHARWAAPSNAPVLIAGETGTGKELLARMIHQNSPRRNKPFMFINCEFASVPTLMESELFGHARGAFTGANQLKMGLIGQADGGTVFLDEFTAMPMDLQAKLFRFLDVGEYRRMGGEGTTRADVRVIAATNKKLRDLYKMAEGGLLHKELLHRLNTVILQMPPLRECKDDIPILAEYFLRKYSEQQNKIVPNISPEAMELLMAYPWPSNARELSNAVQSALVLCRSETIQKEDLPETLRAERGVGNLPC